MRKMKSQWNEKRKIERYIDTKYFPKYNFIVTDEDLYWDGSQYRKRNMGWS